MSILGDVAKFAGIHSSRVWRILLGGMIVGTCIALFGPATLQPNISGGVSDVRVRDYVLAFVDILIGISFAWASLSTVGVAWEAYRRNYTKNAKLHAQVESYGRLDVDERAALACFVDAGSQRLPVYGFQAFGKEHSVDLLPALDRLANRCFVYFSEDPFGAHGGNAYVIHQRHFVELSSHPFLVGSDAPPKTFG